jgi:hypothetical protein
MTRQQHNDGCSAPGHLSKAMKTESFARSNSHLVGEAVARERGKK